MPRCAVSDQRLPVDVETRLAQVARAFTYPATPDLTRAVSRQMQSPRRSPARPAWRLALALAVLLLAVVLLVPPVRAAVLDWIRVGAVRIFLVEPTPAPTPQPGTPTPAPTATPLASLLDISGETTLAAAQDMAGFELKLPAVMPPPDHVYAQTLGRPLVVLVWMEPDHPDQVKLALFETAEPGVMFMKVQPTKVQDTRVNDQPAVWLEGPYLLITRAGDTDVTRLIESGHTLVWTADGITYRLETALPLDEALKIAESIE